MHRLRDSFLFDNIAKRMYDDTAFDCDPNAAQTFAWFVFRGLQMASSFILWFYPSWSKGIVRKLQKRLTANGKQRYK